MFNTLVPPAVVPTDNLYPVAPVTAVHVMVGVVERPKAPATGAVTVGHGIFAVVKLFCAHPAEVPPALYALTE